MMDSSYAYSYSTSAQSAYVQQQYWDEQQYAQSTAAFNSNHDLSLEAPVFTHPFDGKHSPIGRTYEYTPSPTFEEALLAQALDLSTFSLQVMPPTLPMFEGSIVPAPLPDSLEATLPVQNSSPYLAPSPTLSHISTGSALSELTGSPVSPPHLLTPLSPPYQLQPQLPSTSSPQAMQSPSLSPSSAKDPNPQFAVWTPTGHTITSSAKYSDVISAARAVRKAEASGLIDDSRVCPFCSKVCDRPSTLKTHLNSHTGARPHTCTVEGCGRQFTVLSNMYRHAKACAAQRAREIRRAKQQHHH